MNLISILNIISCFIFFISIILIIFAFIKRRIKWNIGFFLIICLSVIFIVAFSNVLEHLNITAVLDSYEEYFEILIIPYFLLFIYSISAKNELNQKKKKEKQLMHSLEEREILLKEVHHRIKNNLQIIVSMIKLQNNFINDKSIKNYLNNTANRVVALGLLHNKIYQSEDLTQIDLNSYLYIIMIQLKTFFGTLSKNINFIINEEKFYTNIDTAIPCGLIINEIITNSIKYAFPKKSIGEITVSLKKINENIYKMSIKDNGIGLPDNIDFEKNCGLGLKIISMLTLQLNGEVTISRSNGTEYIFIIKKIIKEEKKWKRKEY